MSALFALRWMFLILFLLVVGWFAYRAFRDEPR
jgi:hypothetical protein